jgi:TatD DNase family protein
VGLDYHYDFSPRSVQGQIFSAQIKLAQELDKPLVVHCREAFADTMAALAEAGIPRRGVLFHSFTGSQSEAEEIKGIGAFISVNGIITFPKAGQLRQTIAGFPPERIMLETDAPYLAPVPRRGRRNQPEYLPYICNALAKLTDRTEEEIAYQTTGVTRRFFNIPYQDIGTISYAIGNNLYLNITNRCNQKCSFCVRYYCEGVAGYDLRLSAEPLFNEVIGAIGNPQAYDEVVFCGFGEPLLRAQLVLEVAKWIKKQGGKTRIDTNGSISAYDGKDLPKPLAGLVDTYSVSLNALNAEEHNRICRPDKPNSFNEILAFVRRAKELGAKVVVTFVDRPGLDVAGAEKLAGQLGVEFRIRKYYNAQE